MATRNIVKVTDAARFRRLAVFLCLDEEGGLPDEIRGLGVEVRVHRIERMRNLVNVLQTIHWLSAFIKQEEVDLIFSSGGHNFPYCRLASFKTKRPIIRFENALFEPFWRENPVYALNLLLGTNAYFATGKLVTESIRSSRLWREPVFYHPHMIDLALFDASRTDEGLRERLRIPADAFVFATAGRLDRQKGQRVFVQAALRMVSETRNTFFVVAGAGFWPRDKALEEELGRMVEEAGARDRIIFTGFLRDPVPVYAAADVMCHTALIPEPLGNAVLEPSAMKKPVISVKEGGPLELVRDGIDGWLIPPRDVEALVQQMKYCLDHRSELPAMGEKGYQKILSEYHESRFSEGVNRLIESFVSGKRK